MDLTRARERAGLHGIAAMRLRLRRKGRGRDGNEQFGNTAAINAPASVVFLAESAVNATGDHFNAQCWGVPSDPAFGCSSGGDAAKQGTTELEIRRHQEGMNVGYVDGHVKWARFSALWWRDLPRGIYAGSFDPRQ